MDSMHWKWMFNRCTFKRTWFGVRNVGNVIKASNTFFFSIWPWLSIMMLTNPCNSGKSPRQVYIFAIQVVIRLRLQPNPFSYSSNYLLHNANVFTSTSEVMLITITSFLAFLACVSVFVTQQETRSSSKFKLSTQNAFWCWLAGNSLSIYQNELFKDCIVAFDCRRDV